MGVDACKGGWIVVGVSDGQFAGAAKLATFDEVLTVAQDAVAIGVDIPIGLLPDGMRVCDSLARKYVGARRASVFLTPPRKSLEATSYKEANALSRMLTERGLSKQAYALRAKILEVELALENDRVDTPKSQDSAEHAQLRRRLRKYARPKAMGRRRKGQLPSGRVVEVHPECSFRLMAGEDLAHNKRSYNGMMKRRELLEREGISIPIELEEIGRVAVDDVFDAAAAAWSAHRYARGKAKSLPPRELWQWEGRRPIAIWM